MLKLEDLKEIDINHNTFHHNPHLVDEIIENKIEDFYPELAEFEGTPETFLEELSKSKKLIIKKALLKNKNAPQKFVINCFKSSNESLRDLAASNPQLPSDVIEKHYRGFVDKGTAYFVNQNIFKNPNCPSHILSENTDDFFDLIITNPAVDVQILKDSRLSWENWAAPFLRHAELNSKQLEFIKSGIFFKSNSFQIANHLQIMFSNKNIRNNRPALEFVINSIEKVSISLGPNVIKSLVETIGDQLIPADFVKMYDLIAETAPSKIGSLCSMMEFEKCPTTLILTMCGLSDTTAKYSIRFLNKNIKFSESELLGFFTSSRFNINNKKAFYQSIKGRTDSAILLKAYEKTGEDYLLPEEIKDAFLF